MSGNSYISSCGRCGRKDALHCSTETKPFEYNSADCLNCGFSYYTKISVLKKDELKKLRKYMDSKFNNLSKQEQKNCNDFDKAYFND